MADIESGGVSLQWFVAALYSWILRERDDLIAFLREENRVLQGQLRGQRLRLSDEDRRRLAVLAHQLGRAALAQVATIATADTILRWHRELAARRCVEARRRSGRPRVEASVRSLIRRMATENATWGYTRIQGALKNLGPARRQTKLLSWRGSAAAAIASMIRSRRKDHI